jgi:putative transposase
MAELEQWLALEICEQYHNRIHKGIHRSPLAAWQSAITAENAPARSLPDQPDQFMIGFLPYVQRKLRRDGLHLFSIRYWDNVRRAQRPRSKSKCNTLPGKLPLGDNNL